MKTRFDKRDVKFNIVIGRWWWWLATVVVVAAWLPGCLATTIARMCVEIWFEFIICQNGTCMNQTNCAAFREQFNFGVDGVSLTVGPYSPVSSWGCRRSVVRLLWYRHSNIPFLFGIFSYFFAPQFHCQYDKHINNFASNWIGNGCRHLYARQTPPFRWNFLRAMLLLLICQCQGG